MAALLCFLIFGTQTEGGLPDLAEIFLKKDRSAFSALLSESLRVQTDMRPILYDVGNLSRGQALMTFRKLHSRFKVLSAEVTNTQSDANYSWLEVYLAAEVAEKSSGKVYEVTFSFYFKITGSRLAVHRWVLQDIQ